MSILFRQGQGGSSLKQLDPFHAASKAPIQLPLLIATTVCIQHLLKRFQPSPKKVNTFLVQLTTFNVVTDSLITSSPGNVINFSTGSF